MSIVRQDESTPGLERCILVYTTGNWAIAYDSHAERLANILDLAVHQQRNVKYIVLPISWFAENRRQLELTLGRTIALINWKA